MLFVKLDRLVKTAFPLLLISAFIFLFAFFPLKQSAAPKTLRPIPQRTFTHVCGSAAPGQARCHAQVVTDVHGKPVASDSLPSGYGTVELHTAYNLPCTPGGVTSSTCPTPASFGPQTVAIVDAYDDPTVENDLNVYSTTYGLPPCTKANGCLTVVNQNGGTTLPTANSSWALEISLDVQTAHAICQTCKILLVEASSNSILNLGTAVNRAVAMGATAISNSYGASEWSGETSYDSYYNHPGTAVTASAGDGGYGAEYPAAIPGVVGVGGTTLSVFSDNGYAGESVWNGTGSGCSAYETAYSYQTSLSNWSFTGCGTHRGISDISADADPNTGVAVYDSTAYNGKSGWWIVGGTSLSSPIIASTFALAGGVPANINATSILYANSQGFHDVTSGSNGSCGGTIMCFAGVGYDGPTGLGSPNGLLGFGLLNVSPTATPTATPTPTSGPTPTPTDIPTPTPTNAPDATPPTVSITTPPNNSFVKQFSRVTINASASDNVGVTKVEASINGGSPSVDTTAPYSWSWRVPFGKNIIYLITTKAYDAAGNTSTSTVTVTSQ